jgi:hypothetical protein
MIETRQHIRDVNTALQRQGYSPEQIEEWWRQQLRMQSAGLLTSKKDKKKVHEKTNHQHA